MYNNLKQFSGFIYSHLTNQEEEFLSPAIRNTNCHILVYGTIGSGKTSFLKQNSNQTNFTYIVFGRDSTEFHEQNFVDLLLLEKFDIETLANKTITLDDAGVSKQLL